jgi:hypothetical protein
MPRSRELFTPPVELISRNVQGGRSSFDSWSFLEKLREHKLKAQATPSGSLSFHRDEGDEKSTERRG